jgi:dihydrodipicolinate synthase/N-acetylneuraminate lyase
VTGTVPHMRPHGTYPTLPTVLHDDGTLDLDGQRVLAATVAGAGVAGVVALDLLGGEPDDLQPDEQVAVVEAVRDGAGGLPVVVGLGRPTTLVLAAAQRLAAAGADVLLAALGPTAADDDRLADVDALGLPWWLQHHPAVTGTTTDLELLAARVAALAPRAVVVDQAPPADVMEVLGGQDGPVCLGGLAGLFLPEELEVGAVGTTAGGAVVEQVVEVVRRHHAGAERPAAEAFLAVSAYLRLEAGGPGLRVRKEAWRQRGVIRSARVRRGAPLGTATRRAVTRRLREVGVAVPDPYPGA